MPGMMDTILNLGLNDQRVKKFATLTSPGFAFDCYRRLYSNVWRRRLSRSQRII